MGRRRRRSGGWISGILRFFGISSPAVLLMAAMSYFGFKVPTPDSGESPESIAKRAKAIVETAKVAKDRIKERLSGFGSTDDDPKVAKKGEDESLLHVVYQELFEDKPEPSKSTVKSPPTKIPVLEPPPRISDNRDRKKGTYDDDFPEFNVYR